MVHTKICVAIVSTKLQRFESRANVKKTYKTADPEVCSPKQTPEARMVKTDVIFKVSVEFYPSTV